MKDSVWAIGPFGVLKQTETGTDWQAVNDILSGREANARAERQ